MSYPCTGCGSCCRRVANAVEFTKHIPELSFPYGWDESGKCEMLGEDNKCKVYDDRPLLCNVDRIIEFFKVDKDVCYTQNISSCNNMMDEDNIPKQFRIPKI